MFYLLHIYIHITPVKIQGVRSDRHLAARWMRAMVTIPWLKLMPSTTGFQKAAGRETVGSTSFKATSDGMLLTACPALGVDNEPASCHCFVLKLNHSIFDMTPSEVRPPNAQTSLCSSTSWLKFALAEIISAACPTSQSLSCKLLSC